MTGTTPASDSLTPAITEDAWIELMQQLDRLSLRRGIRERRVHPRFAFTQTHFATCDIQPGTGPPARLVVQACDLSNTGISFLHGQYLEPSLRCRITLKARDQTYHARPATVRNCEPIDATGYRVGVAFDSVIDSGRFILHASTDNQHRPANTAIPPPAFDTSVARRPEDPGQHSSRSANQPN